MFKGQTVLGIVPARGGSKRLPGKNLVCAADKPLLGWTLEAGLKSKLIDKLILSTDHQIVDDVGRRFGVDEVLIRPALLGEDDASMSAVIRQVLQALQERGEKFDYFILLQPTSPLRTSKHIEEAFMLLGEADAVGVISVCQTEHPTEWMGKLSPDGLLNSFFRQTELDRRSQEFSPSYQINGAIYIVPVKQFLEERTLFLSNGMVAYVMDRMDSVDIDDEHDLRLAEWLLRRREEKQSLD